MKGPSRLLQTLLGVVGIGFALSFLTAPRYGPAFGLGIGPSPPPQWAQWDERQREEWQEARHREAKEWEETARRNAQEWQERKDKAERERYEKCERGGSPAQKMKAPDIVTGGDC